MNKLMAQYQDSNPEKFNEDFLTLKERDDEAKYLEVAMKSLNYLDGIEYKGMERVKHRIYTSKDEKEEINTSNLCIEIDRSLLKIYKFYFNISKDGQEEEISFEIFYPELIKGQYFLINDNRRFPIYQLLDSSFFNTKKSVVLKTLIMPFFLSEIDNGLVLNAFKKEINPFYYFFSKMGFYETLDFFGVKDSFRFEVNPIEFDEEKTVEFRINKKLYVYIDAEEFLANSLIYNSIIKTFNSRIKLENLDEEGFWERKLGSEFTTTTDKAKKIAKARSTLVSLERGLDELNKDILRLDYDDRCDIYHLLRYMMRNYYVLKNRNNCDLANKRIRSHEYLIYPLLLKFTAFVRRINNGKNVTFEKLHDFVPNKGLIIKYAVSNELLRYDNSCNSISLITKLRFSQGGAQSQFSSGAVNILYRVNHPSFINAIDLLATTTASPGCTGLFTPFCELYDGKYFTELENNEE